MLQFIQLFLDTPHLWVKLSLLTLALLVYWWANHTLKEIYFPNDDGENNSSLTCHIRHG